MRHSLGLQCGLDDREVVPWRIVARAGAVSAPPATPFRMETYSRGSLSLGTATRRTLLGARARTHGPRIQTRTSRRVQGQRGRATGGEREQENSKEEERKGTAVDLARPPRPGRSSPTCGGRKSSVIIVARREVHLGSLR